MYKPRPPKKNFVSYLLPFVIIVSIFIWAIYSFQSIILKKEYFKNTFATLHPWEKWTQVMLSWSEKWNNVSKNIKLFKWDVIKTSEFASINLIWETKVNLDKWWIILIDKLQSNNSSSQVKLTIPEWRAWFDIKRMINPKSLFEIKSWNLLISTKHWVFSLNWNSVRVLEWWIDVDFFEWKKILWNTTIWVWQELIISDSDLNSIKIWTMPNVRAINDEFKLSSWYSKNYKNNWNINETNKLENLESSKEIISWTWNLAENKDKKIETLEKNASNKEDKNEEVLIKKVEHEWEITLDIEKTDIEIFKNEIVNLFWKVPTWTYSVKINDWKLWKFSEWDKIYRYNWALKWENLKEWENLYKIEVFDEDDLKFAEKEFKVFVKIKEEAIEEKEEEVKIETDLKTVPTEKEIKKEEIEIKSDIIVETSLQIISHKEWEFVKILEWQSLEIKWIPSTWAASIKVWDYKLTWFKKWDNNFIFRIAEEWGNAKTWEKNKFEITSFDEEWKEIEVLNFSLFIEK
jgi:hypothetical protein